MPQYTVTLPTGPAPFQAENMADLGYKLFLQGAASGEILRVAMNGDDLGFRPVCKLNEYLFETCGR